MTLLTELLSPLKLQLGALLQVFVPERRLAANDTLTVYSSWETDWAMRPPAIIRKNGTEVTSGITVSTLNGTVTFNAATLVTDVITAEFMFSPFSDLELSSFLNTAQSELSSEISEAIDTDPTVDVDQQFESPILDLAYCKALRALWGQTADYHLWEIEGQRVDKSRVAHSFAELARETRATLTLTIARMRLARLSTGTYATTTGANP